MIHHLLIGGNSWNVSWSTHINSVLLRLCQTCDMISAFNYYVFYFQDFSPSILLVKLFRLSI